jgi:tetratricopeptide (TPR) repeat protein
MKERNNTETAAERKLWARLMRAWHDGHGASHFEAAAQYTRKYPDNCWGWIALADILVRLAHYEAARRALSRADRLAPAKLRGHICVQWGHLYNESCDLKRAEKWYRRAVEYEADTPRLVFLGAVLAKLGRFSEAKRCHRRAARLATVPPDEAYYNLGLILRAERRYPEALRCFDQAIKIDPKYSLAIEAREDVQRAAKLKQNG